MNNRHYTQQIQRRQARILSNGYPRTQNTQSYYLSPPVRFNINRASPQTNYLRAGNYALRTAPRPPNSGSRLPTVKELPLQSDPELKDALNPQQKLNQSPKGNKQGSNFEVTPTSVRQLMSSVNRSREQLLAAYHQKAKLQMEVAMKDQQIKRLEREKTVLNNQCQQAVVLSRQLQKQLSMSKESNLSKLAMLQNQIKALNQDCQNIKAQNQQLLKNRQQLLDKMSVIPLYERQIKVLIADLDEQRSNSNQAHQSYLKKTNQIQRSKVTTQQHNKYLKDQFDKTTKEVLKYKQDSGQFKRLYEQALIDKANLQANLNNKMFQISQFNQKLNIAYSTLNSQNHQLFSLQARQQNQFNQQEKRLQSRDQELHQLKQKIFNLVHVNKQLEKQKQENAVLNLKLQQMSHQSKNLSVQLTQSQNNYDHLALVHQAKEQQWISSYEENLNRLNRNSIGKIQQISRQLMRCNQELYNLKQDHSGLQKKLRICEGQRQNLKIELSKANNQLMTEVRNKDQLLKNYQKKDISQQGLLRHIAELQFSLQKQQQEHNQTAKYYQTQIAQKEQKAKILLEQTAKQQLKSSKIEEDLKNNISKINNLLQQQEKKYSDQINEILQTNNYLKQEINGINQLCEIDKTKSQQNQQQLQQNISTLSNLSSLINHMKNRILTLQEQNKQINLNLKAKNQYIASQNIEITELYSRYQKAQQQKIGQVQKLKALSEEQKQHYAHMHQEASDKQRKLEQQLRQMKLHQKKQAATEETLRSLYQQFRALQKMAKILNGPVPLAIKKFTNHISQLHRPNYVRELQRITQYGDRVGLVKTNIQQHFQNIRLLFKIIDKNKPIFDEDQLFDRKSK